MDTSERRADAELHRAHHAFERAAAVPPAPALPAAVGLIRGMAGMARIAVEMVVAGRGVDPIDIEPRVLRG